MSRLPRVVLNFHGIGTPGPEIPEDEVPYWCPLEEWPAFADALARIETDGRVRLQITFDDGNLSDVEHAMPALRERGLRATFFVCAGRLGMPEYLDESHLAVLRKEGMGIGSHGWSHLNLRVLDEETLRQEAVGSQARLIEAGGGTIDEFAIPFGSYDRRVLRSLRGYRTVYSSDGVPTQQVGRLVSRASYVRGWKADDLARLSTAPQAPATWLRRQLATRAKSLR